eukprot:9317526-Alexandrium_andersonii.AAC.1
MPPPARQAVATLGKVLAGTARPRRLRAEAGGADRRPQRHLTAACNHVSLLFDRVRGRAMSLPRTTG